MEDIIGLEFLGSVTPMRMVQIKSPEDAPDGECEVFLQENGLKGLWFKLVPTESKDDLTEWVDQAVRDGLLTAPPAPFPSDNAKLVEDLRHWILGSSNTEADEKEALCWLDALATTLEALRNFPSNAEIIDDLQSLREEIESYKKVAAAAAIVLQEQLNRIRELTSANNELKIRYANAQAKIDRLEERYVSPIPVL